MDKLIEMTTLLTAIEASKNLHRTPSLAARVCPRLPLRRWPGPAEALATEIAGDE